MPAGELPTLLVGWDLAGKEVRQDERFPRAPQILEPPLRFAPEWVREERTGRED